MKKKASKLTAVLRTFDQFQEETGFRINGSTGHPSVFGCLLSLAVLTAVFVYGFNKFIVMYEFGDA